MPIPDFSPGEVLTAAAMDSIGLWLVKTQAVGAGVSTIVVSDAFSANYDNYLITYTGGSASTTMNLSLRLGTVTTTEYYGNIIYALPNNPTAILGLSNNNSALWGFAGDGSATGGARLAVNLYNPFQVLRTGMSVAYMGTGSSGAPFGIYSGNHNLAISYTSFTIGTSAGTMTGGTVRVYGYRN